MLTPTDGTFNVQGSSTRQKFVCLTIIVSSLSVAPEAFADDAPIDEIQVTATRRPVEANKVSAALTVVGAEDIQSGKLLTDSLAGQVGVYLQQTTVGQGAAIIRGLKGSEILHLVDGLRLNNAIFRNAPTQYLALVPPGSIERMEVVRGSPTSLYGSDAVGGVIQVISRLPRFESDLMSWRRELYLGLDSAELTRTLRASVDVGNRNQAGLFSVAWQESGDREIGGGERIGPSGYESWSARSALVLRPDNDQRWVFDLQFTRQPSTPRVDELVAGFGQTEASSSEYYFEPNERLFGRAGYRRDDGLFAGDWTVDVGWQQINDDRRTRDTGADTRRFEANRSDLLGLSLNAVRDFRDLSAVFGFEFYHDTVHSERWEVEVTSGSRETLQSRFPDGSEVQQAAVFANVSRPIGSRHSLSGGLRLSAVDIDLPATSVSVAADIGIDDFSADIGWLFDVTETTQLLANVGHGFRAPNVFDLGTLGERPGNRFNIPNPALQSERVTQFDFGMRQRAGDWNLELVVYRLDYRDRIQSALTGDMTTDGRDIVQSRNLGKADIHGVEFGLQWQADQRWSADLLVNYSRGEQRESDGQIVAGDRVPPLNGRFTVNFEATDRLLVRTSLVFAERQDRLSPRDVRDSRINPLGTAGWGILNSGLSWQPGDRWQIKAGMENLLDRRYRSHGSGIDAIGRNIYLSASAEW